MDQAHLAKPIYKGFDAIVGADYQYSTLGQALVNAKNGWRILVVGTVKENTTITVKQHNLYITGIGRNGTYIDFGESIFNFDGNGLTFENFSTNFDNAGNLYFTGEFVTMNNIQCTLGANSLSNPTNIPIYFTGNKAKVNNFDYKQLVNFSGNSSYAVLRFIGAYNTLSNSSFDNNTSNFTSGGMVYLGSSSYTTVNNCTFINNSAVNNHSSLNAQAYNIITNCSFFGNGTTNTQYAIGGSSPYVQVNNCFFNNWYRGCYFSYNTIFSNNYMNIPNGGYGLTDVGNNSVVTDNYFIGGGTSSTAGVRVASSSTNTIIANNIFNTMQYGISASGINNISQYGNNFISCTTPINAIGKISEAVNGMGAYDSYNKKLALFKNTSGGALAEGDAVIIKSVAGSNEVTTTTTAGDNKVWGISTGAISNNADGYICVSGITNAKVNGTADIAIGDYLTTYTDAKILAKATAGQTAIAIALAAYTADDSSGLISVRVIPPRII